MILQLSFLNVSEKVKAEARGPHDLQFQPATAMRI